MKDYHFDNVQEFFDELQDKNNVTKMMVYSAYKEKEQQIEEKKEIIDLYYNKNHSRVDYYNVYKICDNFFIVEFIYKNSTGDDKIIYTPCVDKTPIYIYYNKFDSAIIAGLALKYNPGDREAIATPWACKLLNMGEDEDL